MKKWDGVFRFCVPPVQVRCRRAEPFLEWRGSVRLRFTQPTDPGDYESLSALTSLHRQSVRCQTLRFSFGIVLLDRTGSGWQGPSSILSGCLSQGTLSRRVGSSGGSWKYVWEDESFNGEKGRAHATRRHISGASGETCFRETSNFIRLRFIYD